MKSIDQWLDGLILLHNFEKQVMMSGPVLLAGADPGIYVSGGALDRRGVWGPPRSPAGPGQRPVGGPGGRSFP